MAKISLDGLDAMQYDVLKEIGNIGAGNATTALSKMLSIKMDMSVPNVALLPFQDISSVIGSEDQTVVGILLGIEGDIDGMMMFLFDMKSAHHLVNSLMMRDGDKLLMIQSEFGEMDFVTGYFLLIPELDSYDKILASLGM